MIENSDNAPPVGRDDMVQPFQLDVSQLRGRLVRLDKELQEILNRHAYPKAVAQLLAEAVTVASLLASLLKYQGVFTLQIKGDGLIPMLVVDVTSRGDMRGYARFAEENLPTLHALPISSPIGELLGKGYLAFTVDQGENSERYQGIVELEGQKISDCLLHYFNQSEQLKTALKIEAELRETGWRSAGFLLQTLPLEGADRGVRSDSSAEAEEHWQRTMLLLATCTAQEMLDWSIEPNDLLFRLFHEEKVRVYSPAGLRQGCRCSRQRVENVLKSLSVEEIQHLLVDGKVSATCEFCNDTYSFKENEVKALKTNAEN
ncbi:MAG: Hsp33 family molecular chaperone HslO [Alphaproteobacteria bacterium]